MIVLLAPYGRNEVTSAAIRLADLAVGQGREVEIVACGLAEAKVHPAWDAKVRRGYRTGMYRAAARATHVVHFQCHRAWYQATTLVAADTSVKQVLVPNWHGLVPSDAAALARYDRIVCTSRACKRAIHADVFKGDRAVDRDRLTWTAWDAGVPAVRREGTVSDGRIRACFYCDAAAIDFNGSAVLGLVTELLTEHHRLDVTLLATKSWSRRDRRAVKAATAVWGSRLAARRVSGLADSVRDFHAHDWVAFPGVRSDFGLAAAKALSCGAAVIAHDVAPFNDVVTPDSGVLVPCAVRPGPFGAQVAVAGGRVWADACRRAFADTRTLFGLQTRDWKLHEYGRKFAAVWAATWGT